MLIVILIIIILLCINNFYFQIETKENFFDNDFSKDYVLPKVVYGFWDDLENNEIIKSHIRNWRKKISKEWKLIILSKKDVYKYIDNNFIKKYGRGQIDSTRFADFLRLYLLIKNGGCWLDTSIFITNGEFLNDYYDEMIENKYDGCFFEFKENTLVSSQPHIDNWFMMAPKNSKILKDLFREFDRAYDMDFLRYKKLVLINSGILLDKTIGYEDSTYLLQHAIFHYLLAQDNNYKLLLKDASESMYKIQTAYKWDHKLIIDYILNNKNWMNFYGVKLTKGNRREIKNKTKYIKMIDNL